MAGDGSDGSSTAAECASGVSLTVSFLALVGWGAFAYSAGSSASAARDLRAELAQLKATQDQLLIEQTQQQAAVGDLAQIQAKLASAQGERDTLARKREQATVQVTAARQELAAVTKRLEGRRANVSKTGRARVAQQASKSAPGTGPTKSKT